MILVLALFAAEMKWNEIGQKVTEILFSTSAYDSFQLQTVTSIRKGAQYWNGKLPREVKVPCTWGGKNFPFLPTLQAKKQEQTENPNVAFSKSTQHFPIVES